MLLRKAAATLIILLKIKPKFTIFNTNTNQQSAVIELSIHRFDINLFPYIVSSVFVVTNLQPLKQYNTLEQVLPDSTEKRGSQ